MIFLSFNQAKFAYRKNPREQNRFGCDHQSEINREHITTQANVTCFTFNR